MRREAEPAISADVRTTERENRYGGWLEGFDFRLKGEDRLKEKVAEGLTTIGPDARPEEILAQVPDAIRYTFCLRSETCTKGCNDIKAQLADPRSPTVPPTFPTSRRKGSSVRQDHFLRGHRR